MLEKNIEKFEFKKLTPFKWFILNNFPFLDEDFDALTEWQLFQKLGHYINNVINSQNLVGSEMETVVNAYNELYNYVDNYFKNLDVQEEINNKLNDMAEDGTLAQIINQQIFGEINQKIEDLETDVLNLSNEILKKLNVIDTLTNLKTSALVSDQYYLTNGYYEKNDGGQGLYYCRTKTENDVDNGGTIIIVGDLTLELIYKELSVKNFGARGDSTTDDSSFIQKALDTGKNIIFDFSRGERYRLNNSININTPHQCLIGKNNNSYSFIDGCILLSVSNNAKVNVNANNVSIECISFNSDNNDSKTTTCINAENTADIPNLDLKIKNCDFTGFLYQIYTHGRGVLVDGCTFGTTEVSISILYDSNNTEETASTYRSGGRAFVITNNRFHNVQQRSIEVRGGYVNGMLISNNVCDLGRRFLRCASAVDSMLIENNIINFCNSDSLLFSNNSEKYGIVINGNTFYNANSEMDRTYPKNIVSFDSSCGTIDNLTISNNTFKGCNENAINIRGSNVVRNLIVNNTFGEIGKTNEVGCCLRFTSVTRACIVANSFVNGGQTNYAISCDSTGELTNCVIQANLYGTNLMGPYEDGRRK